MEQNERISARQLCLCLYLSVAAEMIIKPFREPIRFPARVLIPAAAFNLLVVGILFWPLRTGRAFDNSTTNSLRYPARLLTAAVLLLSAGTTISEANGFLGFTGDWQLPFALFLLPVIGLVWYAVRLGAEGFARVGGVLFVLFLASIVMVAISNLRDLRLENLNAGTLPVGEITQAVQGGFYLSPVFLAGTVLSRKVESGARLRWTKLLVLIFATYVLIAVLSELVLGGFAWSQRQPFYTLARIGNLSVFRRLDSLYASIWLMALLLKLIVEAAALELLVRAALPERGKHYSVTITMVGIGCTGVFLYTFFSQEVFRWITWGGVTAVLLLIFSIKRGRRKG